MNTPNSNSEGTRDPDVVVVQQRNPGLLLLFVVQSGLIFYLCLTQAQIQKSLGRGVNRLTQQQALSAKHASDLKASSLNATGMIPALAAAKPTGLQTVNVSQLTPFADGKALYTDGSGRFLLLQPATDGSVVVEAVFQLIEDPYRHHEQQQRRGHFFYLDRLSSARNKLAQAVLDDLKVEVELAEQGTANEQALNDLAERAADLHRVKELVPYLKNAKFVVRKAVAYALARKGYLIALKELSYCFDLGEAEDRKELQKLCRDLTGQEFIQDPTSQDQQQAKLQVKAWLEQHPTTSPYTLGVEKRRELEALLHSK